MNRWLVLPLVLCLTFAGCTGKEDGDTDPTPEPTPSATPTPSPTKTTPTPTATSPTPTATPSATPPATPTPTPTTPAPPTSKIVNYTFTFNAGSDGGPSAGIPGLPAGGSGGNCAGVGGAEVLGGNATATYEATALPVGGPGEIELIVLAPDGSVLARAPGPSPITLTIPPVPKADDGVTFVVQYVEEPAVPQDTEVTVEVFLILPGAAGAPGQDGNSSCERVAA